MTASSPPHLAAVRPTWAIESSRVDLEGSGFAVASEWPPAVTIGDRAAQVVLASSARLGIVVPAGVGGGRRPVRVAGISGETAFIDVGEPCATGLHQVDNPVFDREGNLYVTYSGARGQRVSVSVFRVGRDGRREPFVSGLVNATSMMFGPDGVLHVSSRFEGTVYRIQADGTAEPFVTELGVACGLAFDADGTLFVGDRSGTVFRVAPDGQATPFAALPPSVAAYHLAVGPDRALYVTAPTLDSYDPVYRVAPDGTVGVVPSSFGRPQGLAFDSQGRLYVVEALAGASGLYRVGLDGSRELVLSGPGLVGVAFDPGGGLVVTSNETAYRIDVPARPLALW